MPRLTWNKVSNAVAKLNPEIFGYSVAGLDSGQRKRGPKPTLDRQPKRQHGRERRVAVVITIIACRHRLLDDDNSQSGCKPLRDAIARSLGVDDADPRVRWCYGQTRTDGEQGTIVKIEQL